MSAVRGRSLDLIVVGAGVVGAVTARLAIARGLVAAGRVAVIADRLPDPVASADWDLRVYALGRASQRLLAGCGIWEALPAERRYGYERMCVWDASGEPGGSGSISFDCAELGEPDLGHIVDGGALARASVAAARDAGVVFIEGRLAAVDASDSQACATLEDGREFAAPLLVGADGNESRVRAALGIGTSGHSYHQDALVAHVRTEKPHRATAWQRFLPSGPLALLPLPDGVVSIVWSTATREAERLAAMPPGEFADELAAASGGVLGRCTLATPIARFPLRLTHALAYVRPHVALVGDAAHAVHPLAGQGLNLGLLDAAALVDVLGAARAPAEFGELRLLRRYERWRRSENQLAAGVFDGLERLFGAANTAVATVRAMGLDWVGRSGLLKRRFAAHALGLGGDVPEFLRDDRPWPRR